MAAGSGQYPVSAAGTDSPLSYASPRRVVKWYRRPGSSRMMEEEEEDTYVEPDDETPLAIQQHPTGQNPPILLGKSMCAAPLWSETAFTP